MEDKIYVLSDGRVRRVPADQDQAFQTELKDKGLTAVIQSDMSGNQISSMKDANIEQKNEASNLELDQTQINQKKDTELQSEGGLSDSLRAEFNDLEDGFRKFDLNLKETKRYIELYHKVYTTPEQRKQDLKENLTYRYNNTKDLDLPTRAILAVFRAGLEGLTRDDVEEEPRLNLGEDLELLKDIAIEAKSKRGFVDYKSNTKIDITKTPEYEGVSSVIGDNGMSEFLSSIIRWGKSTAKGTAQEAKKGAIRGELVQPGIDIIQSVSQGNAPKQSDLQEIIEKNIELEAIGTSDAVKNYQKVYDANKEKHGGAAAWIQGVFENPAFIMQTSVGSFSTIGSTFVNSETARKRALKQGGGYITAANLPTGKGKLVNLLPGGIIAKNATAFMSGMMGAVSGTMEQSFTFAELMQEELQRRGKDFTIENMKSLLLDDKVETYKDPRFSALDITGTPFEIFKIRSRRRGLAINFVDSVSGLIGGNIVRRNALKINKKGGFVYSKKQIAGIGLSTQIGGGLLSETAGQTLGGQEFDAGEILTEGFAEKGIAMTGITTLPTLLKGRATYQINGEYYTEQGFNEATKNMSDIEILELLSKPEGKGIDIKNDNFTLNRIKQRSQNGYLDTQIDPTIEDPEMRREAIEKEKERRRIKNKLKEKNLPLTAKIKLEKQLEEVENELTQIAERFLELDNRRSEVRQRKKMKDVGQSLFDDVLLKDTKQYLENNMKFTLKGKGRFIYAETPEQAQEALDKYIKEFNSKPENKNKQIKPQDVTNTDGFFIGDNYVINKQVAARGGRINVGGHELLHGIIDGFFESLPKEQRKQLIKDFKALLSKRQLDYINGRLKSYDNIDLDDTVEWFNLFSDGIKENIYGFDQGIFSRLKNFFEDMLRKLSEAGFIGENRSLYRKEFGNARQVFTFMKDYSTSVKNKKEISDRVKKVAAISAEKKVETGEIAASRSAKKPVDDLAINPDTNNRYTKSEWDSGGANTAIDALKKQGLIDNLIAAKYKVRPVPDSFVDDVLGSSFFINHIRSFNPEINDSLFGWVNSQIRNKAASVFNKNEQGRLPKEVKTVDVDARTKEGQPVVQIEDTSNNMEAFTDEINYFDQQTKETKQEVKQRKSKLRKELGIKVFDKSNIFREVRKALLTSPAITNAKAFLQSFEQTSANALFDLMKTKLKDTTDMVKFRLAILESIPIQTLVQMQKMLPEKIFVKNLGRATNKTILSDYVYGRNESGKNPDNKKILPESILDNSEQSKTKRKQGVPLYERLDVDANTWQEYLEAVQKGKRQTAERSGTKGNNRIKILEQSAIAIAKDATPEILTDEFIQEYIDTKGLEDQLSVEDVRNEINKTIERPSDLKFSKSDQKAAEDLGAKYYYLKDETSVDKFVDALVRIIEAFDPGFITKGVAITSSTISNRELRKYAKAKLDKKIKFVKDKRFARSKIDTKMVKSKSDAQLQAINKRNVENFTYMWRTIFDIVKSDPDLIVPLFHWLKGSQNEGSHPHRIGAALEYIDMSVKGKYYFEHALQNATAYRLLMAAAVNIKTKKQFNRFLEKTKDNYKLIAISAVDNTKIDNAGYKNVMALQIVDGKKVEGNWNVFENSWVERYYNEFVAAFDGGITTNLRQIGSKKTIGEVFNINSDGTSRSIKFSKSSSETRADNNLIEAFNKQAEFIKKQNKAIQADLEKSGYTFVNQRGMSTFDFDETVGVSENFVIAKKGDDVQRIASNEWPFVGEQLAAEGYKFDFSDFNKVTKGRPGPLFQKMKNQIEKYGSNNVFILTARAPQSEQAIHDWLKSNGINIPRENVTGLGNSTGEAKAQWMLEKFAEGYNDMYFVDDALPNVKAVKKVLDQLDIKSKVVQAKIKFSKSASREFNEIIEESQGTKADRVISQQEALKMGRGKNWFRIFVPPSAEDFKGLLYRFLGKGRKGDRHAAWFKENLLDPFAKGIRAWNTYKQNIATEYKALKKQMPQVKKLLNKKVGDTVFTVDSAIRVYLWNKAGFDIPGITLEMQNELINYVNNNPEVKAFADALSRISRVREGYSQPSENWSLQSITTDLDNIVNKVGRKEFLREFLDNVEAIFTPDNMNKIEALYGVEFREALENILFRMENGTNRLQSNDRVTNAFLGWINGSIGAIMFFNTRSVLLQTLSTVNFLNFSDNNVFKAARRFANQVQFWKDFAMLFNSDQLKQRRAGLQTDVSASELTKTFSEGGTTMIDKANSVIKYLLQLGFTPTQLADSFAIALGGASFYRNRFNTYKKRGLSDAKAKEQAMLDFQEIAEETQQSSREDLISQQQASTLGRLILAFQNVTMQYTRYTKKRLSDLVNRRRIKGYTQIQSDMSNISAIIYYGAVQNIIFGALQSALIFVLFGKDDDEDEIDEKVERVANGALDSLLRGTGIFGAIIATIKNVALKYQKEKQKGWGRDDGRVILEALQLSPPIGSKFRKIYSAMKTEQYNPGVSKEIGFRIENPNLVALANVIEATTNLPAARIQRKANNVEEAVTGQHSLLQRVALFSGWSLWDIGAKDEELEAAKKAAKEKIRRQKQKGRVRCTAIKSSGGRCKNTTRNKNKRCYAHQ